MAPPNIYTVEIDGHQYDLEGDHEPTEAEARAAIGSTSAAPKPSIWNTVRDAAGAVAAAPLTGGMSLLPQRLMSGAANLIRNHPVESLATLGSALAVPLTGGASVFPAMAAAGLGGAGGAGIGLIGKAMRGDSDTPDTAGGVLATIGSQGAQQAAAEGGGRLVAKGLSVGAKALYTKALSPTVAMRAEHPALAATGLAHAVPVSAGGAAKAGQLTGESKAAADALVQAAASAPNAPTIDPRQAVGGITDAVQQARGLPVARPQMEAIGSYARQYLAEHPGPISLPKAQESVRATDNFYNSAYRATMDRGNAVTSGSTGAALGINNETRNLLRQAVPGLQAQNANTQGLAGLREAVERRVGNANNWQVAGMRHLINAGVSGGVGTVGGKDKGLATFAAMEALSNPAMASRLAIGASKAALPTINANAIRAALLALMAGDPEQTQPTP